MFSQSPQDGRIVRPLSTDSDNRLPRGSGELMDVDEVKSSERNAGKHHNVKPQVSEKGLQDAVGVPSINFYASESDIGNGAALEEHCN